MALVVYQIETPGTIGALLSVVLRVLCQAICYGLNHTFVEVDSFSNRIEPDVVVLTTRALVEPLILSVGVTISNFPALSNHIGV